MISLYKIKYRLKLHLLMLNTMSDKNGEYGFKVHYNGLTIAFV